MSKVEKEKLMQLADWIKESRNIVVFTGAGISTESGIPDFRSPGGIWSRFDPSEFTYQNFVASPAIRRKFWEFYRENWKESSGARPNSAHRAVAALERQGKLTAVITQNIDGLHQAAGSKNVLELHGSMQRFYCMKCGRDYPASLVWEGQGVPHCPACQGMIRPDVVLYGEALNGRVIRQAESAIRRADLMIVGGTSLVVYPAAGLLNYFHGNNLVLINRDETPYDDDATYVFHDDLGEILDQAIQ